MTEAACLVEQGAQYHRRVGLKPSGGDLDPIFAGFRAGAFSLFFGDSPFYHFDLEGRWQRAVALGTHFLKGLDGTVRVVRRLREDANLVLKRHIMTEADSGEFDARIRSAVLDLIADLDAGRLERVEPRAAKATPLAQADLQEFLGRIASWDSAARAADRQRYLAAYGPLPLPFVPPDCQNAVLLEATSGGTGSATFGWTPASEPRILTPAEFQHHASLVAALWGRRLTQSRFAFLAGSDVLRQPVENVAAYLDAVRQAFDMVPERRARATRRAFADEVGDGLEGAHAFLDNLLPPRPDRAGWRELQKHGLVRVSLGVESGDPDVRRLYGKGYSNDDLSATVVDLKSAGMGISLLTLVGAGGVERAAPHVRETARLLESLAVGNGDFVFLLDESEIRDQGRDIDGLTPLGRPSWTSEQVRLKEALMPLKKRGVKVLPYTFDKQWAS